MVAHKSVAKRGDAIGGILESAVQRRDSKRKQSRYKLRRHARHARG